MAFRIVSFAEVQSWSKTSGGDIDSTFQSLFEDIIIKGVTSQISDYLKRRLDKADRTEIFDGENMPSIFVDAYPIDTGATLEVREDSDRVFGTDTLLTKDDDYFVYDLIGEFRHATRWARGNRTLQIQWTGGLLTAHATGAPDWLKMPTLIQCLHVFNAIGQAGWSSRSLEGGSIAFPQRAWLLTEVKQMLAPERRLLAA